MSGPRFASSGERGAAEFLEELARGNREHRWSVPREYLLPWDDLTAGQKLALGNAYDKAVRPKLNAEFDAGVDAALMTLEYHRDVLKTPGVAELIQDIADSLAMREWVFANRPGAREWAKTRAARKQKPGVRP